MTPSASSRLCDHSVVLEDPDPGVDAQQERGPERQDDQHQQHVAHPRRGAYDTVGHRVAERETEYGRDQCDLSGVEVRPPVEVVAHQKQKVLVAPRGYHRRMKQVCEAHDILYVCDEVVTGFGRLGQMFASEACFGVVPDMIVAAKGITSGYLPLGATIVSDRLYDGLAKTRSDGALLAPRFHLLRPRRRLRGRAGQHRAAGARADLRTGA